MLPHELIGRGVKVIAWCGQRTPATPPDGLTGQVWFRVEGRDRVFILPRDDAEVLPPRASRSRQGSATEGLEADTRPAPTVWVTCPPCEGSGRMGGRACSLCEGSGELRADVAEDPDDAAEMEAGSTDDG
jgi:hypothetical protein